MTRNCIIPFALGALCAAACSGDARNPTTKDLASCIPGEVHACPCSDGTQSTQTCNDDGVSFATCNCAGSSSGLPNTGGATSGSGDASGGAVLTGGTSSGGTAGSGGTSTTVITGGTVGNGGTIGTGGTVDTGGVGTGGIVTGGTSGSGGSLVSDGTGGTTPNPGALCLQAGSGDYSQAGPYTVAKKSVDLGTFATLPSTPTTFTIFYPTEMEDNCPHPIIAWGNGTTVTGSDVYAFFNNNAASWGMVVIASDNSNVGSGDFHRAGIDYMLAQNEDPGSEFYHKLGTRAGTSGHSQGAIGATAATDHPNVTAEVQVEGGGLPKAGIAFLALSGTADNIVGTGPPTQSYDAATGPSFLAIYTGADHVTTPTLAGWIQNNAGTIQFMRLYTAWFRCFLADDAVACALFRGGQSCGICSDPNWDTLQSKNL